MPRPARLRVTWRSIHNAWIPSNCCLYRAASPVLLLPIASIPPCLGRRPLSFFARDLDGLAWRLMTAA